jgi:hypothetical protein
MVAGPSWHSGDVPTYTSVPSSDKLGVGSHNVGNLAIARLHRVNKRSLFLSHGYLFLHLGHYEP